MKFNTIIYEVLDERIGVLTLNRPRIINAINREMLQEIDSLASMIEKDNDVRALIVQGAGENFSSGADIKEGSADLNDKAKSLDYILLGVRTFYKISKLPFPTIAKIKGYCIGGGLELAMFCDIRIASKGAKFALMETSRGVIPSFGGTQVLPRIVGVSRAKELIFRAKMIDSEEAFRIGLVNKVVEPGEIDTYVYELAKDIASNSPLAISQAKRAIDEGLDMPLEKGLLLESFTSYSMMDSHDAKEGFKAFIERRKPDFRKR
jgi:enoyl-CoA hydratase